jgi:hypothetical protein
LFSQLEFESSLTTQTSSQQLSSSTPSEGSGNSVIIPWARRAQSPAHLIADQTQTLSSIITVLSTLHQWQAHGASFGNFTHTAVPVA